MPIQQVTASAGTAAPAGIAASQALPGAGALVLTAGAANLGTQQPVLITSAGNDSGINFTITGTDSNNSPVSEVLAGANVGSATSKFMYLSVSSIVASGAVASTVEVGTGATGYSPWLILGSKAGHYTTNLRAAITGASATYAVQATSDPAIMSQSGGYADDLDTLVASGSVATTTLLDAPWSAVRLAVTAGGPVVLRAMESRTG